MFGKKEKSMRNLILPQVLKNMNAEQALAYIAVALLIDLELLKAFIKVESSGKHFSDNGRVTIRFEKHIFERYAGINLLKVNVLHRGQADEYTSFIFACSVNRKAAFNSISMGSSQIMGFNFSRAGFPDAEAMYNAFRKSATESILAFGEFIRTDKKLLKACQTFDYHIMARRYNGKSYKKYIDAQGRTYADRIEQTYQLITQK